MSGDKNFGNFDKIKAQMLQAKQKAENIEKPVEPVVETIVKGSVDTSNEITVKKDVEKTVNKSNEKSVKNNNDESIENTNGKSVETTQKSSVDNSIEEIQHSTVEKTNELVIKIPVLKPKPKKKAVNYYLSLDIIEKIKDTATEVGMKDSNFLEELIRQVLSVSN